MTGSSGLIGRALTASLRDAGHTVVRLVRGEPAPGDIRWDPVAGVLDPTALAGIDAVVNLAGEPVAGRRLVRPWTRQEKALIRSSRVDGTGLVARTIASAREAGGGPSVLLNASAIGIYGDRAEETLDEASPPGRGFLAELVQEWEAATAPAAESGARVVVTRSGIVFSRRGGALGRQLPLFRLGLGGRLGTGRQWVSWISITDEVAALAHCLETNGLHGPVNVVSPTPITNAELTRALGRVLHRPAVLAVPRPALALVLGEVAGELLGSQRVVPRALAESGFEFRHPLVEPALTELLARPGG